MIYKILGILLMTPLLSMFLLAAFNEPQKDVLFEQAYLIAFIAIVLYGIGFSYLF